MNPILFATARSGSTVIAQQLAKITFDLWNGKGYLGEAFALYPDRPNFIEPVEGGLGLIYKNFDYPISFCNTKAEIINAYKERMGFLDNNKGYLIKILSDQYHPVMDSWIRANFTPIFLERRNKLDQILSYMAMQSNGKAHFSLNDQSDINKIIYKKADVDFLIEQMRLFVKIKSWYDGFVVYYEDWFEHGANEKILCGLIGLSHMSGSVGQSDIPYKPTPYSSNPEMLIENKDEWIRDKPSILQRIKGL